MNEFEKIDEILKESFGGGAGGIKKKALQQICIIRAPKNGKGRTVTVVDPHLIETILF
ncbi:MAG: transcriptional regulator, partial [Candidatus Thorarchaeota archaeon]|nr:transcriptional regulator [Candidatus Thorarchaeota archaeon]NIW13554.1 transcriptional regulator [Candidatus Thorarchaeota archaeon]NIW51661.1 transcriptional regulator [Candidatus Korarchaeota archaeon]